MSPNKYFNLWYIEDPQAPPVLQVLISIDCYYWELRESPRDGIDVWRRTHRERAPLGVDKDKTALALCDACRSFVARWTTGRWVGLGRRVTTATTTMAAAASSKIREKGIQEGG